MEFSFNSVSILSPELYASSNYTNYTPETMSVQPLITASTQTKTPSSPHSQKHHYHLVQLIMDHIDMLQAKNIVSVNTYQYYLSSLARMNLISPAEYVYQPWCKDISNPIELSRRQLKYVLEKLNPIQLCWFVYQEKFGPLQHHVGSWQPPLQYPGVHFQYSTSWRKTAPVPVPVIDTSPQPTNQVESNPTLISDSILSDLCSTDDIPDMNLLESNPTRNDLASVNDLTPQLSAQEPESTEKPDTDWVQCEIDASLEKHKKTCVVM